MSQLARNPNFDPALQCFAVHPQYGERCQIFGGYTHTGKHRVVVQVEPNKTKFCWWEQPPVALMPLRFPWLAKPRGALFMVLAAVVGATVIVLGVLAGVVWLMD